MIRVRLVIRLSLPKDITAINWISDHVRLDWAMFACSITPYSHGDAAKRLLKKLGMQGVDVINSAVFNGGFLGCHLVLS